MQDSNQLNGSNTNDIHMPYIPMLAFISTNLLQDRVEMDFLVQDHVHSDQGACRISFEYNWRRGRLFFQEREDDEDMTSMHMGKYGEWHEDEGDLQGFPSREEGPKLIRFESPRWRPKDNTSLSPAYLGVQEQPAQKMTPRSHTESIFNVLYMDGKIISRSFQCL